MLWGLGMAGQRGFWDVEDRLAELSRKGNPLKRLTATVDFGTSPARAALRGAEVGVRF